MHAYQAIVAPTIPTVVRIGFAGSRVLFDDEALSAAAVAALETELRDVLIERLRELPKVLGLTEHHFLCAASQVAVGADMLFTRACGALAIPQRVFLPRPRDEYLRAAGPNSQPDFGAREQRAALELLASPHVIEERVVSAAAERSAQFEDVNLELLRESDVIVCLVRAAAAGRSGGTRDLAERAASAGLPVLKLAVSVRDGALDVSALPPLAEWPNGSAFKPPGMPTELREFRLGVADGALASASSYVGAIQQFASGRTRRHSGLFKRAAIAIIALHIGATVLAILAGKLQAALVVGALLALELAFLAIGLRTHHVLHRSAAARVWAVTRLIAETMRSLKSVAATSVPLDYPLALSYPASLLPLLRTSAVLHSADVRRQGEADWNSQRERYLAERLDGERGQLKYFEREAHDAAGRLTLANRLFWCFSLGAVVATGSKLAAVLGLLPAPLDAAVGNWGGLFAIALPVAAVGFLSWAAASDLEARAKTYAEMRAFLAHQVKQLRAARTARDFARLVRETEAPILEENLNWFSRRLFTSVA